MITQHLNGKVSSNADIESTTEGYEDTDANPTTEDTRFLSSEPPLDFIPGKPTQRCVVLMCVQFIFMIALSQFIMDPPLQEIMEDFICHSQYPDHLTGIPNDRRCKNPDVQGILAMVRSWLMWVGMLFSLLVQIPYGIVADKYGRRPVLFLGLSSIVLANAWYMIVSLQPDVFSIWYLLSAPIPTLIEGGEPVIVAMVWTILSDSIPTVKRTSLFYRLHAMMLILGAAFRPVAAKYQPMVSSVARLRCAHFEHVLNSPHPRDAAPQQVQCLCSRFDRCSGRIQSRQSVVFNHSSKHGTDLGWKPLEKLRMMRDNISSQGAAAIAVSTLPAVMKRTEPRDKYKSLVKLMKRKRLVIRREIGGRKTSSTMTELALEIVVT